ncbi:hypothetical protein ACIGHF_11645 [Stenotrophomonas sp. NPDC077464]|uniref:hypothetical protein n=1 Tax=unclassified Stenotrophomonas TaxID=196198 RepID=UPI0037CD22FD
MKSFPEHVLAHAQGGVIAPSALGQAARADQLEAAARRRASQVLGAVPAQVETALAQAREDGFSQGYADAIGEAVPLLAAALGDVQALRASVLGQLREVVSTSLAAEGVDAALVVRRCEQVFGQAPTTLALHVPEHTPGLGDAVLALLAQRENSPPLQILPARSALPMLKAGPLLFELDPVNAIAAAVEASVDAGTLETAARARARAYAAAINSRLERLPLPLTPNGVER